MDTRGMMFNLASNVTSRDSLS